MTIKITEAMERHDKNVADYEAIFGVGAVWCRPIPYINNVVAI